MTDGSELEQTGHDGPAHAEVEHLVAPHTPHRPGMGVLTAAGHHPVRARRGELRIDPRPVERRGPARLAVHDQASMRRRHDVVTVTRGAPRVTTCIWPSRCCCRSRTRPGRTADPPITRR